jgi:uncharacterized protein with GYD domain
MPTYALLLTWTDQGRRDASTLPDRAQQVFERFREMGGKEIGHYLTMGRYDQIVLVEAPDDETMARFAVMIAGRGNVVSETLRCFSMDEVRKLV